MDVIVRSARPGDGADLARGWLDGCRYYAALDPERFQLPVEHGLVEWFEQLLARPKSLDEVWLVADVDARVVGHVSAELQRPVETAARQLLRFLGETRLFVSALGVEQAYQRRGVATRLMEAVEQWGRERGAVLVSLDTWIHSQLSVPFYEQRMGYQRASIIFEKRLDSPGQRRRLRNHHSASAVQAQRGRILRHAEARKAPYLHDPEACA